MGILEVVDSEHAGIIPRSLAQIFEYAERNVDTREVIVTLSFLQIYRESIQDLLAPVAAEVAVVQQGAISSKGGGVSGSTPNANTNRDGGEEGMNLPIREDPVSGFYVEGLQEFYVRTYAEAGTVCCMVCLVCQYVQTHELVSTISAVLNAEHFIMLCCVESYCLLSMYCWHD
jgi:hypothetical protein